MIERLSHWLTRWLEGIDRVVQRDLATDLDLVPSGRAR